MSASVRRSRFPAALQPSRVASALTERVAPDIFGAFWLRERELIRTRTLPQDYAPRSPLTSGLLRRYEARNPIWREGHTVLCLTPLTLRNILGCMRLAAARALGRSGATSRARSPARPPGPARRSA